MRCFIRCAAVAALVVLTGASARAQTSPAETPRPPVNGAVSVGGLFNTDSGYLGRLAEFDRRDDGAAPRLGIQFWGNQNGVKFDVAGSLGGHQSDQQYRADLNVRRWLKAHLSYVRLGHRLDHDPIDYVDAASGIGGTFVVTHTDFDPEAVYSVDRGMLEARVEVTPPAAAWLQLFASHRQDLRHGTRQSLTTSHCATCHLKSNTRATDEQTRELSGGLRMLLARLALEYEYETRRFSDDAASSRVVYERGLHPATLADVFYNRIQYDARNGELPYDVVPGLRKNTHALRGRLDLPRDATLLGNFTHSTARNTDTQVASDYTGGSGRLVVPFGARATFQGSFRRYHLETDSVFVDVVEPVAPAGPTAGRTYAQAYPLIGSPDYYTASAASRTPTDVRLELAFRPARRTVLKAGYSWEEISRESFAVERTTTNSVLFSGRGQLTKKLQWRGRLSSDWTQDPFKNHRAAIPAVLQPFMSPGNVPFTGLQYDTMYASRQADLTSFPTRETRTEEGLTWSPSPRVSVSTHYRWQTASNHDLNFSTWERSQHAPGAELWVAPGERWTLMAGYQFQRERLETMFSTLAFVG